jgi:hypothetical protein
MKIISWNCRCLVTLQQFGGFWISEDPDTLFLVETEMDKRKVEKLRWMLGLINMLNKLCVGKSRDCFVLEEWN